MKSGAFVVTDNQKRIDEALKVLTLKRVYVGIPADNDDRFSSLSAFQKAHKSGNYSKAVAGINNAQLGYIHDNGSPAKNIPARPFLKSGAASIAKEAARIFMAACKLALAGKVDEVDKALHKVGLLAQNAVRRKITDGPFEPLKLGTLKARARRGRKGAIAEIASRLAGNAPDNSNARPLIDTGQLRASITYVIRFVKGRF